MNIGEVKEKRFYDFTWLLNNSENDILKMREVSSWFHLSIDKLWKCEKWVYDLLEYRQIVKMREVILWFHLISDNERSEFEFMISLVYWYIVQMREVYEFTWLLTDQFWKLEMWIYDFTCLLTESENEIGSEFMNSLDDGGIVKMREVSLWFHLIIDA